MKRILIFAMLLATCAGADTVSVLYGLDASRTGYDHLDSAVVLENYGTVWDTLWERDDGDSASGIRVIDTFFTVTGTGTHYIYLKGVYDGYTDEWYTIEKWTVNLSIPADIAGGGTYNATVYAIDTSGTDDTVSGIQITAKDATGTVKGYIATNSAGYSLFHVDSGQWTFLAPVDNGYVWNDTVCTLVAANTTFDMYGYDLAVGSPSGDSLCRVYGYCGDPESNAIEGVEITYTIKGNNIWDVCNDQIMTKTSGVTYSDVNGYFYFDLFYSKCLQRNSSGTDSLPYEFNINYPDGASANRKNFYVPAADSAQFSW